MDRKLAQEVAEAFEKNGDCWEGDYQIEIAKGWPREFGPAPTLIKFECYQFEPKS